MTTNTKSTLTGYRQVHHLADSLAKTETTIAGYRKMLRIAERHGMEYEVERINQQIDEYEADAECLRDELVELGYDPE